MGGTTKSRWAALGAAVAVSLGAGGLGVVSATISSGSRAVFVPITPCRLVDTRPGGPGSRDTPLRAGETATFQVRGVNGDCTIPAGATAISGNATITGPSDDGFMTIAPSGGGGNSSNLNWLAGQSPTPNAFTVALSADGRIDVRNDRGTVDVILDVNGYYEDHHHDDRYYTRSQTDAALAGKANSADVYTRSQIDASGMNAVRAAGLVQANGTTASNHTTIGTFTTTRTAPGSYRILVPGLAPGCSSYPLIFATLEYFDVGQVAAGVWSMNCATGDTEFVVATRNSAGSAAADLYFKFVVYAQPSGGLLEPTEDVPSRCDFPEDGSVVCE